MIIAGSLTMVLSVVVGLVLVGLVGSRLDLNDLQRDVVISGDESPSIPGKIAFSVDPPLDRSSGTSMAVGVAVETSDRGLPDCTITDSDGKPVVLTRSPVDDSLLNRSGNYVVLSSARLAPGDYTAACAWSGEPSKAPQLTTFTVGRTLDNEDVGSMLAPILGVLAVVGVAGVAFVVGLILLIVGLVKRSKAARNQPGPYGGMPHQYPDPYQPGAPVPPWGATPQTGPTWGGTPQPGQPPVAQPGLQPPVPPAPPVPPSYGGPGADAPTVPGSPPVPPAGPPNGPPIYGQDPPDWTSPQR